MICPNDEGVIGDSWENGVYVGQRRHASPDHFVYATLSEAPEGAMAFETVSDGRRIVSYCLACGDEACREEHARNVEKNRRERIALGPETVRVSSSPRGRLSSLAG